MSVVYVDCSSKEISCAKIGFQSATVYLPSGNSTLQDGIEIHSLNYLEIATEVLSQLPEAELVDKDSLEVKIVVSRVLLFCNLIFIIILQAIRQKLVEDLGQDWLIYFTESGDDSSFSDLQYRRLPALLPHVKLGRINCNESEELCKYVFEFQTKWN